MKTSDIPKAIRVLKKGGLVAFPTETVYGLGADASNVEAVQGIFRAKQRPMDHPVIVHLGELAQLSNWAVEISPQAYQLANAFWPGPLTLILNKAPTVLEQITGGQATVGIRIPSHPVAQTLLKKFGSGVAAPSANRFGRISPTTAEAVYEELGETVGCILDGGQCEGGLESTIIDLSGVHPMLLRPGLITLEQIEAVLKEPVLLGKKNAPRVSGALESHYAPQTLTCLIQSKDIPLFLASEAKSKNLPRAWVLYQRFLEIRDHWVLMSDQPKQYAHDLYQTLRDLDRGQFKQIMVEAVPEGGEWNAIRDRLRKATTNPN